MGKLTLKKIRGEDGFHNFSVRVRRELVDRLDVAATKSGRSRNELISTLLEYALDNLEIEE